jgi:hypothetical protein
MTEFKTIRVDIFDPIDPVTFIQLQVEIELLVKKLLEPEKAEYDIVVYE